MSAGLSAAAIAGIAGTAISAGSAIYNGVQQSDAAQQAGQAQQQGIDQATALQREMWQKQQQNQAPWLAAGRGGLNALNYGLGIGAAQQGPYDPVALMGPRPTDPQGAAQWDQNAQLGLDQYNQNVESDKLSQQQGGGFGNLLSAGPEYKPMTLEDMQIDPGYKFRLKQGLKALDRTASARGGLLSGGALKAAEGYGQEMGSQEYGNAFNRNQINQQNVYNRFQTGQGNQYNRLAAMAGVGQTAAQNLSQADQQYGSNAGNLMVKGGENQGNALLAGANARGSMYQGIGNAIGGGYQQYQGQQNFNRIMTGMGY